MRIGIDLGGSKIEVIALARDGSVLWRHRVATPAGDYPATLAAIRDLVAAAEAKLGRRGRVGIGTPGSISPKTGLLRNSNSTVLNGRPLDRDIAAVLDRPVRLANDADCFALSEATDGAARGRRVVFGVILGTGVGGGIVVDGALLAGPNRVAGEWGHNPMPWPRPDELPAPPCYCGKHGCIETFLSGPGLARDYRVRGGDALSAQAIAEAAARDPLARDCLSRYHDRLGRAIAHLVNILDPDAIVLGGGLSNVASLYAAAPAHVARWVFSDVLATEILVPVHGDASGVRGAAWLWPDPDVDADD